MAGQIEKTESSANSRKSGKQSIPEPKCWRCGGERVGNFWGTYDGEIRKVCKGCYLKNELDIKIKLSVPPLFRKAKIEDLPAKLQEKINNLPEDGGLLLWGMPGVGKSYAMAAIIKELIRKGREVTRIDYEMICLKIRDTYKAGSTTTELDVITPLINAPVLIIEDVGTTVSVGAQESDFSLRTFLVLLNQRLEKCKQTFITTNKPVEELAKSFDSRIASRLQQLCEVIHLTGKDKRIGECLKTNSKSLKIT